MLNKSQYFLEILTLKWYHIFVKFCFPGSCWRKDESCLHNILKLKKEKSIS